jgi:hypothetical protein
MNCNLLSVSYELRTIIKSYFTVFNYRLQITDQSLQIIFPLDIVLTNVYTHIKGIEGRVGRPCRGEV